MLQRVSFRAAATEVEGILHLPEGAAVGGIAVLADADRGGSAMAGVAVPEDADGGDEVGTAPPSAAHVVVASCEALAAGGVAALRFAFRQDALGHVRSSDALADAAGAMRLLKSHPALPGAVGVAGFGFGGAIAAVAAGRDSRVRCAVLAGAPATIEGDPDWRPMAEASRTRARVLLLRGSRDTRVTADEVERYASVLSAARVTRRVVTIEGADHHFAPAGPRARALEAIVAWARESL
ncbi:MAG: alpha/beta hydrolase family protein [Candidatus Limnocylindria bacterium]